MFLGASVWSLLVGTLGGVLLVCAVLLAGRLGARRSTGAAGAGLLLLGLALSGVVGILAQALAIGFNPVRWVGLAATALGVVMLSSAGMLPGRRGRARSVTGEEPRAVDTGPGVGRDTGRDKGTGKSDQRRDKPPAKSSVDSDMAEIEDILRRRGIQ
jgi:hypothetical protein